MNRTLWTVSASSQYSVNVPPRVLDGSSSTYWSTTNTLLPANIDLNMGTVRTVKGFNLTPPSTSSYRFMTMEVLSSQDGNSWNQEGTFNLATNTSTVRTLKFVTPVTAQYFRFNVTRGSGTTYTGIAEINGVE
ncbi:MAG: discoidin domain-containing protein [Sphingobacteriales bacterium]|nr:discoidin domain-containing protein [Sphingobacteriales bacterium]